MIVFSQMALITVVGALEFLVPSGWVAWQLGLPYEERLSLNFNQDLEDRIFKHSLEYFERGSSEIDRS